MIGRLKLTFALKDTTVNSHCLRLHTYSEDRLNYLVSTDANGRLVHSVCLSELFQDLVICTSERRAIAISHSPNGRSTVVDSPMTVRGSAVRHSLLTLRYVVLPESQSLRACFSADPFYPSKRLLGMLLFSSLTTHSRLDGFGRHSQMLLMHCSPYTFERCIKVSHFPIKVVTIKLAFRHDFRDAIFSLVLCQTSQDRTNG